MSDFKRQVIQSWDEFISSVREMASSNSSAAEALRFAVEEIPAPALMGAYLEVDEARFGTQEIRYLYENAAYPLTRPTMLSGVRGGG